MLTRCWMPMRPMADTYSRWGILGASLSGMDNTDPSRVCSLPKLERWRSSRTKMTGFFWFPRTSSRTHFATTRSVKSTTNASTLTSSFRARRMRTCSTSLSSPTQATSTSASPSSSIECSRTNPTSTLPLCSRSARSTQTARLSLFQRGIRSPTSVRNQCTHSNRSCRAWKQGSTSSE